MRHILIAVAALLLAACSTFMPSNKFTPSKAPGYSDSVATLASVDTCEYEIAPLYTKMIVARGRAARGVAAGSVSVDKAKQVQATADAARALLDRACPKGRTAKEVDRDVVARASALLKGIQ